MRCRMWPRSWPRCSEVVRPLRMSQQLRLLTAHRPHRLQVYASRTGTRRTLALFREWGWRLMVSARGVVRTEGFPYALDNGAWTSHTRGEPFCDSSFLRALHDIGEAADFVVIPDVVGNAHATLVAADRWLPLLVSGIETSSSANAGVGIASSTSVHLLPRRRLRLHEVRQDARVDRQPPHVRRSARIAWGSSSSSALPTLAWSSAIARAAVMTVSAGRNDSISNPTSRPSPSRVARPVTSTWW